MSNTKNNLTYKRNNKIKNGLLALLIYSGVFVFISPFFMMVSVAVKSPYEALTSPSSWPTEIHLENFGQAWETMDFTSAFLNSFYVTFFAVGGIVIFGCMASYVIGKSTFKPFNKLYVFFVAGIMIPFQTSLVPLVQLVSALGLSNTRTGLVLIYWGRTLPLAMFLYIGFVRSMNKDITEAAAIDGASVWTTFWKIVFPMLTPITTTVIIVNSLWIWNDYLLPSLVVSKSKLRTIPLSQFYFNGSYGKQWQLTFSAYILGMIPILILYIFLQKYIIKGIAAGAVKG